MASAISLKRSQAFELVVGVLRWPFLALFVLFMLAVLYRYGACRRSAKWHWVSVGSLFAMVVWQESRAPNL